MRCPKCNALMVFERFYGYGDDKPFFDAFRCYSCGEIVDEVILENRNNGAMSIHRRSLSHTHQGKESHSNQERRER